MTFILYTLLAVMAVAISGYAYLLDYRRRNILKRAFSQGNAGAAVLRPPLIVTPKTSLSDRVRGAISRLVPATWLSDSNLQLRLLRAGREDDRAVFQFVMLRIGLLIALPVGAVMFVG